MLYLPSYIKVSADVGYLTPWLHHRTDSVIRENQQHLHSGLKDQISIWSNTKLQTKKASCDLLLFLAHISELQYIQVPIQHSHTLVSYK